MNDKQNVYMYNKIVFSFEKNVLSHAEHESQKHYVERNVSYKKRIHYLIFRRYLEKFNLTRKVKFKDIKKTNEEVERKEKIRRTI